MSLKRLFGILAAAIPLYSSADTFAVRDAQFSASFAGFDTYTAPEVIDDVTIFSPLQEFRAPYRYGIAKLRRDGSLDASWGDNGLALDFPDYPSPPIRLANGKYLVIVQGAGGPQVWRIDGKARLDPAYGSLGIGSTGSAPALSAGFIAWALQPDGALAIAMTELSTGNVTFARVDPDGNPGLAADGHVIDTGLNVGLNDVYAWSMAKDGTVEVGFYSVMTNSVAPQVLRFAASSSWKGVPVPHRAMPAPGAANWISDHAKVDGFGRVVIASGGEAAQLWRFNADGTPDAAFNSANRMVPLYSSNLTGSMHFEQPIALWGGTGGRWVLPSGFSDTEGVGFFQTVVDSGHPVTVFDDANRVVARYDSFGATSLVTRLDDGSFLYLDHPDTGSEILHALTPQGFPRVEATMIEYYNTSADQYFITLDGGEAATLDASMEWQRTGYTFGAWMPVDVPGAVPVCRFYGDFPGGASGHFFTPQGAECDGLLALAARTPPGSAAWRLEGITFSVAIPVDGSCSGALLPVYRLYNGGASRGLVPNHRYTVDTDVYLQMQAQGWTPEGIAFCVPPEASRRNQSLSR